MSLQEKVPCAYCRNKYSPFNVQKHEMQCMMNPKNGGKSSIPTLDEEENAETVETTAPLLKIRNVFHLPNSGVSAIFNINGSEIIVPINFVGTIISDENELPSLLIVDSQGFLKAPATITGFQSITTNDQLMPAPQEEQEDVFIEEHEPDPIPEPAPLTAENTTEELVARIKEIKPT